MFKTLTLAATAFAITAAGIAATPAAAQEYDRGQGYAYDQAYRDGYNRPPEYRDQRAYQDRAYQDQASQDQRRYADPRGYQDRRRYDDRRYYNQSRNSCRSGATGSILGAIAGGLLGNSIAGRGDRTLGTVLGAGGGALAGHAIEKGGQPGYCR